MGQMMEEISEPRAELSKWAPRIISMQVPVEKIRLVIGKGGETINGIIARTGAKVDIDDDGNVFIASPNLEAAEAARQEIEYITADVEVGKTYTGGNTVGYVNNGPLCPHAESYDEEYLEGWGTQRYVAMKALDAAGMFAPAMNVDIVPTDKQEEYDFTTDGLTSYVQQFVADSVKYGVTDDSWNAFKAGLNTYGYDFYVEFWNAKYHHEL